MQKLLYAMMQIAVSGSQTSLTNCSNIKTLLKIIFLYILLKPLVKNAFKNQ